MLGAATLLGAAALVPSASAATTSGASGPFTARGSVEQVDVTGATPGTSYSLVNRSGKVTDTRKAGSLGGIVFRHVDPGSGYRVRRGGKSGLSTPTFRVLSDRSAPPSTGIYHQTLPTSGYGYLTTRDGTQLAINVRLPTGATPADGPFPTLIEYSGYGYADPYSGSGGESSISLDPERLRVRRGQRQYARHRLLGRRLRLLRAAPGSRRLRRDRDGRPPALGPAPQGGDDGRLLRRHQPALRRRHPAARASPRSPRSR